MYRIVLFLTVLFCTVLHFTKVYWVPVQTPDPQTSYWFKRRTGTNIGLVQTSDWEKRRTSTNVRPVQMSDVYIYKGKRQTLVEFEKKTIAIRNKFKKTLAYCDEN